MGTTEKRATMLKVSAPFHCALMAPAAERLRAALDQISVAPLRVPMVANVDAAANQDAAQVADLLVTQVTSPVRWEQSVQALAGMGVTRALELGAGSVLRGLARRIAKDLEVISIGEPADITKAA